ncbi:MAG TPA: dTMP kinase, partial [Rhodospirillaceae bacterium]|nr:dTMP kinase [Rhodospirillaceae bacterium]
GAMEEALLLFAARRVHVERVIRPALARGEVVVCDRFTDSTRAYQGHAGDLGPEAVEALDRLVLQGFGPDLTFVLDLPVEAAFARIHGGNGDRFEGRALAFHEALRRGYRAVAASFPERCALVNAAQDPDALAAEILTLALKRLGPARGG